MLDVIGTSREFCHIFLTSELFRRNYARRSEGQNCVTYSHVETIEELV